MRKSFILMALVIIYFSLIGSSIAEHACVVDDGTAFFCGDTVTKSCTLNGSMTCPNAGYGLIIGAKDVVINGTGFKIIGNQENITCNNSQTVAAEHSGIIDTDYGNVTIKNLEIENFYTGIALGKCSLGIDNIIVTDCKIHDCGNFDSITHGIHMIGVNNCTISKNDIYNINGTGPDSGCGGGGNGIFMYGVSRDHGNYNNIIHNNFTNNVKSGFFMKMMCMYNNIGYNKMTGNGQGGVVMMCKESNYNIIEGNNASENAWYGIFTGGNNNTIRYNTMTNNGYHGIELGRSDGSYNNKLYNNVICGNNDTDIKIYGFGSGTVGGNNTCCTTMHYDDDGITGCNYDCSPAPDLTIIELSEDLIDSEDKINKTYKINYTIKNNGDMDAEASNTSIKIDGIEVAVDHVKPLNVGESHTITMGPFKISGGYDTICLNIDKDNNVFEKSKEYNNCLETILFHPEMPDLVISTKTENWITEGSIYNITCTVENIGTTKANKSNTSIRIDEIEVAVDHVNILNINESHTITFGPFTITGNNDTVLICADCDNNVAESDETNNCKINSFRYSNGDDNSSTCSDGTPYGECSVDKPKYCDNGILIDDCIRCGCQEGQNCNEVSGSCYEPGDGACIGKTKTFYCQDTVTESCTLNGNMVCSPGHGLIIKKDGITINGNGYKITGKKSTKDCANCMETGPTGGQESGFYCGIYNNGYDDVIIEDLEIEDFCTGIGLFGNRQRIIENNKITNCNIHNNGFKNTFNGQDMVTHGIHASFVRNLEITGNEIYENEGTGDFCGAGGNGIFLYAGVSENHCDISHNILYNNAKAGFWTKMMLSKSTIAHNEIWGNGDGSGIADDVRGGIILRCKKSSDNLIEYNRVHDHVADGYGYGIYIGGSNNTIEHNTVTSNSESGIYMGRSDGSFDNKLYNNLICDNEVDIGVTTGVTGNTGDGNTCKITNNYDDTGTTNCLYSCQESKQENGRRDVDSKKMKEEAKETPFAKAGGNGSISLAKTKPAPIKETEKINGASLWKPEKEDGIFIDISIPFKMEHLVTCSYFFITSIIVVILLWHRK